MFYEFKMDFGQGFVSVPQPLNHYSIKLELIFTSPTPSATIQNINFVWGPEVSKLINKYVADGLEKGMGIYEGIPLQILICNTSIGFDLILDLANENASFECDQVQCPIRQVGAADWLVDVAGSFSFWYLAGAMTDPVNGYGGTSWVGPAPGKITLADFKKTPYCISLIPDYGHATMLTASLLGVAYQISQTVTKLGQALDKLISDIAATAAGGGLLSGIGASLLAGDALIVIAEVGYLVILLNTYVNLLNEIGKQIIQFKKYKYCMREQDLFRKITDYLGLQFSSTIFASGSQWENATWMPKKIVQLNSGESLFDILVKDKFTRPADEDSNSNAYGYYDGTAQQFLQDMIAKYNGSLIITNGVLHFEEQHFWNTKNPYKIDNTSPLGYVVNSPDPHGTNASELPPTLFVEFQVDQSDLNTAQDYRGTTCQVLALPKVEKEISHRLMPQGQIIQLPCALGKRKSYLTPIEKLVNVIWKGGQIDIGGVETPRLGVETFIIAFKGGIDVLLNIENVFPSIFTLIKLGGDLIGVKIDFLGSIKKLVDNEIDSINLPGDMDDRIGWLLLSGDTFSIPKTFIGYDDNGDWKLSDATALIPFPGTDKQIPVPVMSAANLVYCFQGKNMATRGNQYLTYKDKKFKFCCEDYLQILNNNVFVTPIGSDGKFTHMLWNMESEIAENVDYRIKDNFTNNLTETVIIDGVQQ